MSQRKDDDAAPSKGAAQAAGSADAAVSDGDVASPDPGAAAGADAAADDGSSAPGAAALEDDATMAGLFGDLTDDDDDDDDGNAGSDVATASAGDKGKAPLPDPPRFRDLDDDDDDLDDLQEGGVGAPGVDGAGAAVGDEDEDEEDAAIAFEDVETTAIPRPAPTSRLVMANFGADVGFELPAFDPETYEHEPLYTEARGEDGETKLVFRKDNIIRWRVRKDAAGHVVMQSNADIPEMQSNARMVEWSDGSWTLQIGSESYLAEATDVAGDYQQLWAKTGQTIQCHGALNKKMSFKLPQNMLTRSRKLKLIMTRGAGRGAKIKKTGREYSEREAREEEVLEEKQRRNEAKMLSAQRRRNDRVASNVDAMNAAYLEAGLGSSSDDDDEEDGDFDGDTGNVTNVSMLKQNLSGKRKRGASKRAKAYERLAEEEAREARILTAKQAQRDALVAKGQASLDQSSIPSKKRRLG